MKLNDIVRIKYKSPYVGYRLAFLPLYFEEHKEQFALNEGLEKSYPRQDVAVRLEHAFHVYIFPEEYDPNNLLVHLNTRYPPDVDKLMQMVIQLGWLVISIEIDDAGPVKGNNSIALIKLKNHQYQQAVLTLEATHGIESVTPRFLYHATLLQVWETKIKQKGLSPKSKSILSTHPERVYFTTTVESAVAAAKVIAQEKLTVAQNQKYDPAKFNPGQYYKIWVILEVDTSKIPNIRGLSYFRTHEDPNIPKDGQHAAVYSQNYVPPTAIKFVKEFNAY